MRTFRANNLRNGLRRASSGRASAKRRGIVLIEFCLAFFFVFLPLCLALMQYGMIIQSTLAMNNISREAGRYASLNALAAPNNTALEDYVISNAAGMGIKVLRGNINVTPPPNTAIVPNNRVLYNPITITIQYDMSQRSFLQAPFTNVYRIPIFKSTYMTSVVMIMQ